MALDQEYFDSISIDVAKKKYYNVNKVNAVLDDIRVQAAALMAENASLREQLHSMNSKKAEIGDTLMSAQALARRIIAEANERADAILADAEAQRQALSARRDTAQECAARNFEQCVDALKQEHMKCIDMLNSRLQDFLCELNLPEAEDAPPTPDPQAPDPQASEPSAPEKDKPEENTAAPEDLPSEEELQARIAAMTKELKKLIG